MAEGRFLSKSISYSLQLASVSFVTETVFYRCLPHLDVDGRMRGEPSVVRAMIAPLKDSLTLEMLETALAELERAGLLERYTVNGACVIAFPGFDRHQRLRRDREAPSKLPPKPPEKSRSRPARSRESSNHSAGVLPESSGLSEVEVEGQVKGEGEVRTREQNGGGWPGRLARIFETFIGHVEPGEVGNYFSEPVKVHGEEAVERGLTAWAKEAPLTEKPQFLTPKSAARQIGAYIRKSQPVQVYDGNGEPTPEFLNAVGRSR